MSRHPEPEGGLDYIAVATITGTAIARHGEPPGHVATGRPERH